MRQRLLGSLFVVAGGLLPALIGGPIFAVLLLLLGIGGYREYLALATRAGAADDRLARATGSLIIGAFGVVPLISGGDVPLFGIVACAVGAPMVLLLSRTADAGSFTNWSLWSAGMLYLGLPIYAGVSVRSLPGTVQAEWLAHTAASLSLGWEAAPRGLAWALTAILATWIGDSAAYLGGRRFGRHKLAPKVSPGKTFEGALFGLAGSALIAGMTFASFGLGPWHLGLVAGGMLGIAGQLGDLSESFLKRQAGVKDSGTLIPGHGGILDRIDALLFAFPVALILATGLERLGL